MEPTVSSSTSKTAEAQQAGRPVVRVLGKGRKNGANKEDAAKTSSRGVRRLTDIDKRVSKAVRRMTRALDSGVDSYIEHRDESASARKDGAVVDLAENVSHGVSKAVSEAAPLLTDMAEALNTRKLRKQIRQAASTLGKVPLIG